MDNNDDLTIAGQVTYLPTLKASDPLPAPQSGQDVFSVVGLRLQILMGVTSPPPVCPVAAGQEQLVALASQ